MRRIGIVTVGRSDYGIFRPVLRRIAADAELEPVLFVSGAHLSPELGGTVSEIEADGFPIAARIDMELVSDDRAALARSMGVGVLGFGEALAAQPPDILLLLGDRFEMLAAAVAAAALGLPLAHIHGGELSLGAMDDAFRHAITKLSHLHFVSTETYRRRVEQLGEAPERVVVCGAPSLDKVRQAEPLGRRELEERFSIRLPAGFVLTTFHPATLEPEPAERQFAELLGALDDLGRPVVFTMPNADPGGRAIRAMIRRRCAERDDSWVVETFGAAAFFSVLRLAAAMLGNSSSGIVEAASFELPVVDVGERQAGRVRGRNVIHAPCRREAIRSAAAAALEPSFRAGLRGLENPYGSGGAAEIIVERLRSAALAELPRKRFHDLAWREELEGAQA